VDVEPKDALMAPDEREFNMAERANEQGEMSIDLSSSPIQR
jgi:hypothetical protein